MKDAKSDEEHDKRDYADCHDEMAPSFFDRPIRDEIPGK